VPLEEMIDTLKAIIEQACPGEKVISCCTTGAARSATSSRCGHRSLVSKIVGVDIGDAGTRQHLRSLTAKAKAMVLAYQLWLAIAWRIGGRIGDWMTLWMARTARCPSGCALTSTRA
jgi:hypothetical protein